KELLQHELQKALKERLTPRERRVIELRYGLDGNPPKTLDDVGDIFGISRERVRQIQKEGLEKLRDSSVLRKLEQFRQILEES
ncbi:MAG: sigma-70 family RNA polymerase sigma factor, partial [Candidatus Bipolaricaulis anaerobius]|nr:sigma-70 family RNA polymerase sigma factor [Candidatus Bipolaricaulis anaerobius]MDD5764595.1 sigma-70 family RNA polymerase sigma factor [Candidatus Bipolaricaulis anaerobius]